jgi:hypothetical protein
MGGLSSPVPVKHRGAACGISWGLVAWGEEVVRIFDHRGEVCVVGAAKALVGLVAISHQILFPKWAAIWRDRFIATEADNHWCCICSGCVVSGSCDCREGDASLNKDHARFLRDAGSRVSVTAAGWRTHHQRPMTRSTIGTAERYEA